VQVLARPTICWALLTLLAATGTYYALLFTLAQYLQKGLGDSPLVSGLALVPCVMAFGLAGQLVRRLPPRMAAFTPGAGCLLLAAAYSAISIMLFTGHHVQALLIVLLGAGGLGLGIQFSALIRHLTTAVPAEYAADISGVSTTALQIGAAISVAAFGTLYLSLTSRDGVGPATHAFAITTAALAVVALLATATAALTTWQVPHQRNPVTTAHEPNLEKPGRHGTMLASRRS
jgi:predicted MFS family arabinose efflux permease